MTRSAIKKKAVLIDRVLVDDYGLKKQTRRTDPTAELILTVLSQNTNDINRDRAFQSLKARFPSWRDVAFARKAAVAASIRVGGLANIKSRRIIRMLQQIASRSSDYSLSFLNEMSDKEALDFLLDLDGVGPKTAACVLLFSLGRKAMPVDTHVHRVGIRLGLIPGGLSAEDAHQWFMDLDLQVDVHQLHLNMIQHGRMLCRPRNPKCGICPLKKLCLYYNGRPGEIFHFAGRV
jgi:endonuclease-3